MRGDQQLDTLPALDLLNPRMIDRLRSAPLHSQAEAALREIIEQHFQNGDVFFKELEIAERFGISRPTVRQALGTLTRSGFLDRRPFFGTIVTKSAPALQRTKTQHVAIFVSDYDLEHLSAFLQKIMEECRQRGHVAHSYYIRWVEDIDLNHRHMLRSPAEERCISLTSESIFNALQDAGYRTVCLEAPSRDFTGLAVETDPRMAVQIGVDYLRSLGHEKITLLVNEPASVLNVQDKIEQFRAAHPVGEVVNCGTKLWENSYQAAYAHMPQVWASRPTAIMTTSDPGGWAALHWLAEQGIPVPGEVSVLGYENARSSQFVRPALSTVAHPLEALAAAALEILWGEEETNRTCLLPPNLIIRDSTGPCR